MQAEAPSEANFPPEHSPHPGLESVETAEYFPTPQVAQEVDPVEVASVPDAQTVQTLAPFPLYLPAAHAEQPTWDVAG